MKRPGSSVRNKTKAYVLNMDFHLMTQFILYIVKILKGKLRSNSIKTLIDQNINKMKRQMEEFVLIMFLEIILCIIAIQLLKYKTTATESLL